MSRTPELASADPYAGYTPDKVRVLLKMATWYVRLRNQQKVDRLLDAAIDLIENQGGMRDAMFNRVLDKYADDFRRLKRPVEAGKLADLAQRVRLGFPDQFYPDGEDTPWWLQKSFTDGAPQLPVEFHSSHAEDVSGWDWVTAGAAAFVATVFVTLLLNPLLGWLEGSAPALWLWLIVPTVVGPLVQRRSREAVVRKGAESWVRVTHDGVEYHDPKKHCLFRWTEIEHVWTSWQSGAGEDVTHPSVVVVGRGEEFEMSSAFFTEAEVRLVNGLCKLHSGQITFEDWRERPQQID